MSRSEFVKPFEKSCLKRIREVFWEMGCGLVVEATDRELRARALI